MRLSNTPLRVNYEVTNVSSGRTTIHIGLKDGPPLTIPQDRISPIIKKLEGEIICLQVNRWPPTEEGGFWMHYDGNQIYPRPFAPVERITIFARATQYAKALFRHTEQKTETTKKHG